MALRADERRDKLRKAAVRSKYPLTRRCLNGETRLSKPQSPYTESIGIRREPGELKHLSSLIEGMKKMMPIYRIIGKIPAVKNFSNKIIVLEKE